MRELDNLVPGGNPAREAADDSEIRGLLTSARNRLNDAARVDLSLESRFDLAYNAAHAAALATLRWHGYRSKNRITVFQALAHTIGWSPAKWRVLTSAHALRNTGEYEGVFEVDEQLVNEIVTLGNELYRSAAKLTGLKL